MQEPLYPLLDKNVNITRMNLFGVWACFVACILVLVGMTTKPTTLISIPIRPNPLSFMPGWPSSFINEFDLYASSLLLANSQNKTSYYVFVTSKNDPAKDPLIVWLNGGPGCSSLIGLFLEIGPYVIEEGQNSFTFNPYSWNNETNVLFLESPCGVGFSKGNTSIEEYNDETTMLDQYDALQQFFRTFPEFTKNDLWLSGESYAGIYIPNLAFYIDKKNMELSNIPLNLKGMMLGNPLTSWDTIGISKLDFLLEESIISQEDYYYAVDLLTACNTKKDTKSQECISFKSFFKNKTVDEGINPYDTHKACFYPNSSLPCYDLEGITNYMNHFSLRSALGLPNDIEWKPCSGHIGKFYQANMSGSVFKYPDLIDKNYGILIFSGDSDSIIPYQDTQRWIEGLNRTILINKRPWNKSKDQESGFIIDYDGITFVTIKGAGHMAPQMKREETWFLMSKFIKKESLATHNT